MQGGEDRVGWKRRGKGKLTFLSVNMAEVTAGIDNISYSALEFFCFWVHRLVYSVSTKVSLGWNSRPLLGTRFERKGDTWGNK